VPGCAHEAGSLQPWRQQARRSKRRDALVTASAMTTTRRGRERDNAPRSHHTDAILDPSARPETE